MQEKYVVHAIFSDWANQSYKEYRHEFKLYGQAFHEWKRYRKMGARVGLFHWDKSGDCVLLTSTEGYNLTSDPRKT